MSNSTKNLIVKPHGAEGRQIFLPVDGGSHIYEGTLVSQLASTAMLVPGSTASSGPAIGVAMMEANNTDGDDGDATGGSGQQGRCRVEYSRIFEFANGTAGNACSEATPLFSVVYMSDDHTIYDNDGSGSLQPAGRFCGMTEDGKVKVFVGMSNLGDALADAEDVAIADTGAFTSETDVEGALAEIYPHLLSGSTSLCFSLHSLREVDANGDVGNAAANGGQLASDTTPILRADAAESEEVSWAAANVDAVQLQTALPSDFDGTANVTMDLWVYTGNTNADAATFSVETSWDGGAKVTDTATDGAPSGSVKKITATIAAADIPNTAEKVTITLIPAAHATDNVVLVAARMNYKRALLTS